LGIAEVLSIAEKVLALPLCSPDMENHDVKTVLNTMVTQCSSRYVDLYLLPGMKSEHQTIREVS
jgi:hypothetical protein